MFAVIKTEYSIRRIINYNENKLKKGIAKLIAAVNNPIEADHLTFQKTQQAHKPGFI